MKAFFMFYLIGVSITAVFIGIAVFIEKKYDESHPVKKWWRKHVIGKVPPNMDL